MYPALPLGRIRESTHRCSHLHLNLNFANTEKCLFHSGIIYLILHWVFWDLYLHIIKVASAQEHILGDVLIYTGHKQLQAWV